MYLWFFQFQSCSPIYPSFIVLLIYICYSYAQRLAAAKASGSNMGEVVVDTEEDPLLLNDADLAKRAGSPAFLAPEIVWEYMEHPDVHGEYPFFLILLTWFLFLLPFAHLGDTLPPVRPPVTKSIDIWALGVTLYCLLFGKTPFRYSWDMEMEKKRKERAAVVREHPCDGQEGEGGQGDEKEEEPEERFTEWMHYHWVCNKDWTVPETMGYDDIETGGRGGGGSNSNSSATQTSSKEGAIITHLLDHFLRKDMDTRITLEEVKVSSVSSIVWLVLGVLGFALGLDIFWCDLNAGRSLPDFCVYHYNGL